tara:strand:- start:461 stop:712 length:252 start_codon:yes stop_codon:yes gene_type:complete
MLEQEYLELSNQLKEEFDKKDAEMEELKRNTHQIRKTLISAYGFVRILDIMSRGTEMDMEISMMIGMLRSYLSDEFDNFFSDE